MLASRGLPSEPHTSGETREKSGVRSLEPVTPKKRRATTKNGEGDVPFPPSLPLASHQENRGKAWSLTDRFGRQGCAVRLQKQTILLWRMLSRLLIVRAALPKSQEKDRRRPGGRASACVRANKFFFLKAIQKKPRNQNQHLTSRSLLLYNASWVDTTDECQSRNVACKKTIPLVGPS